MKVFILGYGWLGKYLYELFEKQGHQIAVTSRSAEKVATLNDQGINAILCNADNYFIPEKIPFLPDVVIHCIPPAKDPDAYKDWCLYFLGIQSYLENSACQPHWIHMSSSGIYPDTPGYWDESFEVNPENPRQLYLSLHEKIITQQAKDKFTILRLSGLIGGERNPIRFYHHKAEKFHADEPVNMIHGEDVAAFTMYVMENNLKGIWNVCAPFHPTRAAFYQAACQQKNLEPGMMHRNGEPKRRLINTDKIKEETDFRFIYEDPRLIYI
jgi:nucleoside-diphosphate-sugar epimerase